MSISVSGVARVTSQPAQTPASDSGGGSVASERVSATPYSPAEVDAATNQPKPPRFPWLSRLTSALEPAAKQKPTFSSAPPLGENLDQAV
jgi:predicted lipid-binding transport protein (Tim44 family)